jgi:hypothetical protein
MPTVDLGAIRVQKDIHAGYKRPDIKEKSQVRQHLARLDAVVCC